MGFSEGGEWGGGGGGADVVVGGLLGSASPSWDCRATLLVGTLWRCVAWGGGSREGREGGEAREGGGRGGLFEEAVRAVRCGLALGQCAPGGGCGMRCFGGCRGGEFGWGVKDRSVVNGCEV